MEEVSIKEKKSKNILNRITSNVKKKIFQVTNTTLKYESMSQFGITVICFLELMQLLSYTFNSIFKTTWMIQTYQDIFTYLNEFFEIFIIIPYLSEKTFPLYLAVFYILILVLFSLAGVFIYLSLALKNNRVLKLWPIHSLKLFGSLFNSVLLIPMLQCILPILNCSNLLQMYPSAYLTCLAGEHLIHFLFAIIGVIILLIFSFIFGLFYYDLRPSSNNYVSRLNTNFDLALLINKIIIVIFFEFLNGVFNSFEIFLSFILLKASAIIFFVLRFNNIYYMKYTKKIYSIMTSIFFYSNIILLVSQVVMQFNMTYFDGYFELWCLFVILTLIYEYFYEDEQSKYLLFSIDKIITPDEALEKINFFIELVDKKDTVESSEMILKGFIFQHEDTCEIKECPLKIYKQRYLNKNENIKEDEVKLLLAYCNKLFEMCIFKFPKDIQLRLCYSAFLLGRMKSLPAVKFQIHMIKNMMPSLTQQLTLYRFKRVIEEEYYHMDDENTNLEIVSAIAFEQFSKAFKESVERVGILYIDFWNAFVQDDMNMVKLKSLGYKINDLISDIFNLWNKMQLLNPNDGESNRIYGQFLTDILNEKALGQQFIEKYRSNQGGFSHLKIFRNDITSLCTDGSPVILAKPLEGKSAVITQMTFSVTRLLGYSKMELIGKNISVLLPQIFRDFHNYSVAKFLRVKNNARTIESKKIAGLALHKTGFVIPIKFTFILLPSLTSEPTIGIIIQKEKFSNYTGHLLINKEMEIVNLSPECIKLFNITDKGVWSIRNYSNIRKEDRMNLRSLIQELPNIVLDDSVKSFHHHNDQSSPTHTKKIINLMKDYMDKDKLQTIHFAEYESSFSKKRMKDSDMSSRKPDSSVVGQNNNNFTNLHNVLRRRSSVIPTGRLSTSIAMPKESSKHRGIYQNNQQVTGTMLIKEVLFSGKSTEYYTVKLEYIQNANNNSSTKPNMMLEKFDLKFTDNKMIMYDKDNSHFIIEGKEKLQVHRISKLGSYFKRKSVISGNPNQSKSNFQSILKNSVIRENNSKDSPNLSINLMIPKASKEEQSEESKMNISSVSEKKKHKKVKKKPLPQPAEIPVVKDNDRIEDLYKIHGIQNYGVDLEYRWDYVNNILRLNLNPGESRIIKEIIEITETETMPFEDIDTTEEEDDENEENSEKNKIEIKKSEIFSKEHISTSGSFDKLQWSSCLILVIQFIIATISFVHYSQYLNTADLYIDAIMYLSKQLNYTLSSADLALNKIIINQKQYTSATDKAGTMEYLDQLLKYNSMELYSIRANMSENSIFTDNQAYIKNSDIDFEYLVWYNSSTGEIGTGKLTLEFFESSREINSAIFTLTEHFNLIMDFWSTDAFYAIYNSLNHYFYKSYYYFTEYNLFFINTSPNHYQIIIILTTLGVFITVMIFLSIFFVDSLDKMYDILLEFLSIRPGEAQMIVKRCENFVKNVRINNTEDEEDDKEEEVDAKDLKRNNIALIEKLKKMRTGHFIVFFVLLIGLTFLEIFYIINFVIVSNHKNNLNDYVTVYNSTQNYIFDYNLLSASVKTNIFSKNFHVLQKQVNETILNLFNSTNDQKVNLIYMIQNYQFYSSSFSSVYNDDIMIAPLKSTSLMNFSQLFSDTYSYPSFDTMHSDFYDSLASYYNLVESNRSDYYAILNNNDLFNANFLLYNGLNVFFKSLSESFYNQIKAQNSQIQNFNVIWYSIYQIMVIGFYFLIWRPIENKLNDDVRIFYNF